MNARIPKAPRPRLWGRAWAAALLLAQLCFAPSLWAQAEEGTAPSPEGRSAPVPRLVVLDFTVTGGPPEAGARFAAEMRTALSSFTSMQVAAPAGGTPACADADCAADQGQAAQALFALMGTLRKESTGSWSASALLVDVRARATLVAEWVARGTLDELDAGAARELSRRLSLSLAGTQPAGPAGPVPRPKPAEAPPKPKEPEKPAKAPPTMRPDQNRIFVGVLDLPIVFIFLDDSLSNGKTESIISSGVSVAYQRTIAPVLDLYGAYHYAKVETVTPPSDLGGTGEEIPASGHLDLVEVGVAAAPQTENWEFLLGGGLHWLHTEYSFQDPALAGGLSVTDDLTAYGIHLMAEAAVKLGKSGCTAGVRYMGDLYSSASGSRIQRYSDAGYASAMASVGSLSLGAGCRW